MRERSKSASSLLGVGIYTLAEAARLSRVSAGRIKRWVRGYSFRDERGNERSSPPLWTPQHASDDIISFRDLVEVRFVDAFLRHGVSWPVLRASGEKAAEILATTHPFSHEAFKTDGRKIFLDVIGRSRGSRQIVDAFSDQLAFVEVLKPFLFGIKFDRRSEPTEWWPLGEKHNVLISPDHSFGQPIVARAGILTRVLANGFQAEGDARKVASWFGIKVREVEDAVRYEKDLRKAA